MRMRTKNKVTLSDGQIRMGHTSPYIDGNEKTFPAGTIVETNGEGEIYCGDMQYLVRHVAKGIVYRGWLMMGELAPATTETC